MAFCIFLLLFSLIDLSQCEFYDSVDRIQVLMEMERYYLGEVEKHLEEKNEALENINRYYKDINAGVKHFEGNKDSIEKGTAKVLVHPSEHPSSAIELTQRYAKFWKASLDTVFDYEVYGELVKKVNDTVRKTIPTNKDLLGTYSALSRLQEVYNLDTKVMAKGIIGGFKAEKSMDLDDCRNMGLISIRRTQMARGLEWFRVAKKKTKNPRIINHLETLWRLCKAGNDVLLDDSVKVNDTVSVNDEPEIDEASTRLFWEGSESLYVMEEEEEDEEEGTDAVLEFTDTINITATKQPFYDNFVKYCRLGSNAPLKNLSCHLQRAKITYGYWKYEEISAEPLGLKMYYDVIWNSEVKKLKRIHAKQGKRAATGIWSSDVSESRVGRIHFLGNKKHAIERKISKRIQDMTGLDCGRYAESLQLSHYGMGGHYNPHYDSSHEFESVNVEGRYMGDRWATFMIYFNEVGAGGSTVFPHADLAVKPIKNAAVFWWNLRPDTGTNIVNSIHAGCPVLHGSKWVANKWIHSPISRPHNEDIIAETQREFDNLDI